MHKNDYSKLNIPKFPFNCFETKVFFGDKLRRTKSITQGVNQFHVENPKNNRRSTSSL